MNPIVTYHTQSKGKKGWYDVVDPGYDTIEEAIEDYNHFPVAYKGREFRVVRRTLTEDIVYSQPQPTT